MPDEDRTVNILQEHLEPVVPQQRDQVKVILGEDRESMGQLLSIDTQEGVVELHLEKSKCCSSGTCVAWRISVKSFLLMFRPETFT